MSERIVGEPLDAERDALSMSTSNLDLDLLLEVADRLVAALSKLRS